MLGRLRVRWALPPPRVLRSPLAPAGILTASGIRLPRWSAVSRGQLDFERDDLVPHRVAALAIGDGLKLAQPATCIPVLGFDGLRLVSLCVNGWWVAGLIWHGVSFVYNAIIARMPHIDLSGLPGSRARTALPGVHPAGADWWQDAAFGG